MGGERAAARNGVYGLVGHDQGDAAHLKRVFANAVGQLETGTGMGKVTITRDANQRIASIAIEYDRPGGTVTKTRTVTRDANQRIIELSEAT